VSNKLPLFGIDIDALNKQSAVQLISDWLILEEYKCRYVVTPNVDHIVILDTSEPFRAAYADAALVLADGNPIVIASKLFGAPLPETVPGSDLVPLLFTHICNHWDSSVKVFLLGAGPGVAETAASKIHNTWPKVSIVGTYCPPLGFEHDEAECASICKQIADLKPDLLVIGLGAPKQELWVHRFSAQLPVKVALCVGATIDFLAGEKKRAPVWIRKLGLEWLHRMLTEPKRLIKRYCHDAFVFPKLLWKEYLLHR